MIIFKLSIMLHMLNVIKYEIQHQVNNNSGI